MISWSYHSRIRAEKPVITGVSLGLLSRGSQVRVLPRALGESMREHANACKRGGSHRGSMAVEHASGRDVMHVRRGSWSHRGRIGAVA